MTRLLAPLLCASALLAVTSLHAQQQIPATGVPTTGGTMTGDLCRTPSTNGQFCITARSDTPLPVPTLRPLGNNNPQAFAFDLTPYGIPVGDDNSGGVAHMDICNGDFISNSSVISQCASFLSMYDGTVRIGSRGFGTGSVGGKVRLMVNGQDQVIIGTNSFTFAGIPVPIGYNELGNGAPVQPAATNLWLQSTALGTAPNTVLNSTIASDAVADPFGGTAAWLETKTGSAIGIVRQNFTISADATTWCGSVYFSSTLSTTPSFALTLALTGGTPLTYTTTYNFATGVTNQTGAVALSYGTYPVQGAPGWLRLYVCGINNSTNTAIQPQIKVNDATSTLYTAVIYGPQLQNQGIITGYLPTVATSVTSPLGTAPAPLNATTLNMTGQLTNTLAIGTAPFVITSTTVVANLNAALLNGATFAAPGAIGGTTPAAFTGTTVGANTQLNLNGKLAFSATAPTIANGGGLGTVGTITGSATAFDVTAGTGAASVFVITLPTATNGWVCNGNDITTHSTAVSSVQQTVGTNNATTVTMGAYSDISILAAVGTGDHIRIACTAY